jgi:hypothetical protein
MELISGPSYSRLGPILHPCNRFTFVTNRRALTSVVSEKLQTNATLDAELLHRKLQNFGAWPRWPGEHPRARQFSILIMASFTMIATSA